MRNRRLTFPHAIAVLLALAIFASGSARARAVTHHERGRHSAAGRSTSRSHRLHRASASYRHGRHSRYRRHRRVVLGQRTMDPQRALEIQQALVQAHYLTGTPTGQWDPATQAAMVKYQADNGWQTRITPDSRALIKLGLGPKQDEGEYATAATPTVSKLSGTAPADTLSTMATSAMPAATGQN